MVIVAPTAYLLGGVQVWLDYLVSGLEAAGWTVTVLLVHGTHSDAHRYLRQHPFDSVRLVENRTGSREGRVRALAEAIGGVDSPLVLAVNIVDTYEAVARLRRIGGAPKVAMALHGLHASFYQDIAAWSNLLDGVVCANRLAAAAAIVRGGMLEDRVHYAPCGVPVPVRLREPSTGTLALLYAGRFDAVEKRVLDLPPILRALDRLGLQFTLTLAGAGPAEADLRRELRDFEDRVEFLGVLDETQMHTSFYRPGAVALVMSPSETGPLAAWEAMANGVVLVCSRFVGIGLEGGLRDGETCLSFPVGDTEQAALAVARLSDPALRHALVKAGYELVKKRYSREVSVRAWDSALRTILRQNPLPPSAARVPIPAAGRLDRYFGSGRAETLRRLLRLRFRHGGAGGEWPHSYGADQDEHFHRLLEHLDQPVNSSRIDS